MWQKNSFQNNSPFSDIYLKKKHFVLQSNKLDWQLYYPGWCFVSISNLPSCGR